MSSNEYMRQYMARRYQERKEKVIEHLGGKCINCSSVEGLEIDHIDPSTKSFVITTRLDSRPWVEVLEELEKCQLLCKTCHKNKTITILEVEHGSGLSGKKNCSCSDCRSRKAEYMREYMKTHVRKRDRKHSSVAQR